MSGPAAISPLELCLALGFIILTHGASILFRLGLGRDLWVGTLRTFGQLFLMGYALQHIFAINSMLLVLLVFLLMLGMGLHISRGRVRERTVPIALPMGLSMLCSYALVSYLVTGVIVGADPWWRPDYFIPISGMVIGNSMSSMAISLDRLFSDLRSRRDEVEMRQSLGASAAEASQEIVADAVRAGVMPAVTSMMGVGLVFLPGMMTGQILSGADPLMAVRYQIVVMLMLVGSAVLGCLSVILLARKRCFTPGQQLKLR